MATYSGESDDGVADDGVADNGVADDVVATLSLTMTSMFRLIGHQMVVVVDDMSTYDGAADDGIATSSFPTTTAPRRCSRCSHRSTLSREIYD